MANSKMTDMFPAFSYRNFRLFFFGQCISLIGTWMQNIGQQWLVLELTDSAFKLGVVSAVQFLPMMFFSLFAGTLVDRFPKRTVLIVTQTCLAVLAAILATLTYFNVVQYWHVLVLAALLGVVNTLDMPTRQSFFVEIVGRGDLMNAIALNSTIFNLARILGPAAAGLLIGAVGIGPCFYLNALSFIAVIISLRLMDIGKTAKAAAGRALVDILGGIKEGLSYIKSRKMIYLPLFLLAVTSMFVMNFTVLLPYYAQKNLGLDATGFGILSTSMGVGSFVGALIVAVRSRSGPRMRYMLGGAAGMSILLALLGLVSGYLLACILLLILGFFAITFTTLVNSTIQLNSADAMRGRVMSVYSLVFGGVTPIGSLYTGELATVAGAPASMVVSGAIGVVAVGIVAAVLHKGRTKQKDRTSD